MSVIAKVWRKIVDVVQVANATVTGYVAKTLKANIHKDKTVDQFPQLLPRLLHTDYLLVSTGRINLLNVFLQLPRSFGKYEENFFKITDIFLQILKSWIQKFP